MALAKTITGNPAEAGCDEAGRGCLAGPVVAAAIILPPGFDEPLINDSKLLSEKMRNQLRSLLEKEAVAWSVAYVDPQIIDEINILNASILAMHRALETLRIQPGFILVDGNRFKPYQDIPHLCIVKGDRKSQSIAAASILAKTHRDEYMRSLHQEFPAFSWNRNKGYPSPAHRRAIANFGITPHHRKSFRLLPDPDLFQSTERSSNFF